MHAHRYLILVLLLALILAPAAVSAAQPSPVPGEPSLFRIYFNSQAELELLSSRLDVWEVHPAEGWLLAYLTPEQALWVEQSGLRLKLDAAATQAISTPPLLSPGQTSGIPGFSCYRTVEETFARLGELAAQYPALANTSVIGQSWLHLTSAGASGYNLNLIKLTNSQVPGPKPVFFLMAEIHAREYVTAETALRFAEYLLQNYGVDPDITWLLDTNEIDILPMTNPDGRKKAETGLLWRKNLNPTDGCLSTGQLGVDLNRNSSFGWGSGIGASPYACDDTFMGSAAGSEPETQAIETYLTNVYPDRRGLNRTDAAPLDTPGLFVTLHSYGPYVLWPYGDQYTPSPNNSQLQTLGRKLAYYNHALPGQSSVALYATSGATDDFAYGSLGVAAFTFEMGSNFFQDCSSFESSIWPDNRDALLYAFKSTRLPYQAPAGPELTTPRLQAATVSAGSDILLLATASDNHYSTLGGAEPSQAIQAARFSIDQPSWAAGAVFYPMTASDGAFDSASEQIRGTYNTAGMTPGRHTLFMEAQDGAGNWGVPSAVFLNIQTYSVTAVPQKTSGSAPAGGAVSFTVGITNSGSIPDSYTLSTITSPTWETQLSATSAGPLAPGESVEVTVTVQVPAVPSPSSASTVFKTQSQGSAAVQASSELTIYARWLQFVPVTASAP